jgi:WD40 repeat protein
VWDASTGKKQLSLIGHTGKLTDATFSPDGRRIVTTSGMNERHHPEE